MALRARVPLAWKNLTHEPRRLALAVGGIAFAVLLMFAQLGFRGALLDSTVELPRKLNADLVILSRGKYALNVIETFPRSRLYQALGCEGVATAYPLYIESRQSMWQDPVTGQTNPIRVLAFEPEDPVLLMPEVEAQAKKLVAAQTALADVLSKSDYGVMRTGLETELSAKKIRIVGTFTLGTDFANDGTLIMSADNYCRYFYPTRGRQALERVDLGLVKLAEGADATSVRNAIAASLPDDVMVMLKADYIAAELKFWQSSTPIGFVFGFGTAMGFVVGVIICYQILYSDISDHMAEFATLKAMGYRNSYFIRVVLQGSLLVSFLGFVPGLAVSYALYRGLALATGLLLHLSFGRCVFVLTLTIIMCVVSGSLTVRKVLNADPAELF